MAKKVKLELETLSVDSFHTSEPKQERGTVRGQGHTSVEHCAYPTPSCDPTETFTEPTCRCLYPRSNVIYICCNTDQWCQGASAGSPC